jgi:hypothetical protein
MITAWNAQKDKVNKHGCVRFAEDTGQTLTTFYSHDTWTEYENIDELKGRRRRRKQVKYNHSSTNIPEGDQTILWNLEHNATEHIPGKLTLCIGMPVMIRYNIATELCITKGQEGTVAGWDSKSGPYNKEILETLFVKLTDPPKPIHLDGLPLNIIPITKISSSIKCRFYDDQICNVKRLQVPILPNFAMTDYASQGKTRPNNVVDLTNSTSHQSYYTALSRSATANGTAIVQNFSSGPITGGCSGWLRQEFRELELLDDITTMAYNSISPKSINSDIRHLQIKQYRDLKGSNYVPKQMSKSISWSSKVPFDQEKIEQPSEWKIIERKSAMSYMKQKSEQGHLKVAMGSVPVRGIKRKIRDNEQGNIGTAKKLKPDTAEGLGYPLGPIGLVWDNQN